MGTNLQLNELTKGYTDDFKQRIHKSPGFSGKFLNGGKDPAANSAMWSDIWTDAMLIANSYPACTGFIVVPTNDPPVILMKGGPIRSNCGGSKLCHIGGVDIVDKLGRTYRYGTYRYKIEGSQKCVEQPGKIVPDSNWDVWVKDPQVRPLKGCKTRNDGGHGVRRAEDVVKSSVAGDWKYGTNTVAWDRQCSKASSIACGKPPNHRCSWYGSGGTTTLTNFIAAHRVTGCNGVWKKINVPRGRNRVGNSMDHQINQNTYVLEKCATNCKADSNCIGVTVPHHTNWWSYNPKPGQPRRAGQYNCITYFPPKKIKRQSGMTKATYDAVKKSYTDSKNQYNKENPAYKKFADERVKNPVSLDLHTFNAYRKQVIAEGFSNYHSPHTPFNNKTSIVKRVTYVISIVLFISILLLVLYTT